MKKYAIVAATFVLIASAIALIYYLAKSNLFFHATGVFWPGAITGVAGCLLLSSLILTISLITTKTMLTKKHGLMFSMLILSGLVTAALFLFKPGDSDVWWYGAIAGFFSCLLLVILVMAGYLVFKFSALGAKRNSIRPHLDEAWSRILD